VHRPPIYTGTLHGHYLTTLLIQPLLESGKIFGKGPKIGQLLLNSAISQVLIDVAEVMSFVNIRPTAVMMHYTQNCARISPVHVLLSKKMVLLTLNHIGASHEPPATLSIIIRYDRSPNHEG